MNDVSGASADADQALAAAPSSPSVSPLTGFDPSRLARQVLAECVGPNTKVRSALLNNALVGHPGAVSVWQALTAMHLYAVRRASAMSARSGETSGLAPQDASAVPQADAQPQPVDHP